MTVLLFNDFQDVPFLNMKYMMNDLNISNEQFPLNKAISAVTSLMLFPR